MNRKILSRRREKASAAVEFAILLPILVSLVVTTVVFGDIFITKAKINAIVREAARVGAEIGKQNSSVGAANASRWANNLNNEYNFTRTQCSFSQGGSDRGTSFIVSAVCSHELIWNPLGVVSELANFSGTSVNLGIGGGDMIVLQAQHSFRIQKHKSRFP